MRRATKQNQFQPLNRRLLVGYWFSGMFRWLAAFNFSNQRNNSIVKTQHFAGTAFFLSFFLSFFLNPTSVYLTRLGVGGYYSFDHTQRHTIVCRTPVARRRDLFLTNTQHSQQTNIHVPGGIQTCNSNRRAAAGPRLRPLGHWDRQVLLL